MSEPTTAPDADTVRPVRRARGGKRVAIQVFNETSPQERSRFALIGGQEDSAWPVGNMLAISNVYGVLIAPTPIGACRARAAMGREAQALDVACVLFCQHPDRLIAFRA
jgi:hypothetical protein